MKIPPAILAILAEQERQLARVNPRHRAKLMAIGTSLAAELEAALKKLRPGKYTTTETRTVLVQVQAMLEVLAVKFGLEVTEVVEAVHTQGAKRGRKSLVEQLVVWESEGLLPDMGAKTEAAAELLDPGLLELHEASKKAYGEEVIAKMRMTLSRGQMANETIAQTAERIEKDLQIPDWRAERIVRTEHSFALHRRQILDLIDTFGDAAESEFYKQLLAVFDNRTGDDSRSVHEQLRPLLEQFEDSEGRRYQHPPNRPNDRESMIFVPAAFAAQQIESQMSDDDRRIIDEAASILNSDEMRRIREAASKGEELEVKIGGRTIIYVPDCPDCGMTLFGEDGFIIGRGAFARPNELEKAILQELKRLDTSAIPADGATAKSVRDETDFARDKADRLFDLGRWARRW